MLRPLIKVFKYNNQTSPNTKQLNNISNIKEKVNPKSEFSLFKANWKIVNVTNGVAIVV